MSTRTRRAILFLALAGLVASVSSTYVHYQLLRDPQYLSFCDISQTVSCTAVYLSPYGSVGGIPVALGGALWFGLVVWLTVVGGISGKGRLVSVGRIPQRARSPKPKGVRQRIAVV